MTPLPPLPDLSDVSDIYELDNMVQAYGQQCRDAALLEAAELCEEISRRYLDWDEQDKALGAGECAALLRAKVKK